MAFSIVIDMLMKTGSFETDTKRAEEAMRRMKKTAQDTTKGIRDSFAGNLLADFVQGWIHGLAEIPKHALDSVDALNDVADATGAAVEKISALEDIGARTGTPMETITAGLVKFNDVLKDLDPDSKAADVFRKLGLDAEKLKQMDPADALLEKAQAFSKFEADGTRARNMQELFGKSTAGFAAYMKDLSEQTALVGTVSAQQAQDVEDFNKQLFQMQKNAADAGRAFMGELLPGINAAAQAWKQSGLMAGIDILLRGTDVVRAQRQVIQSTNDLLDAQNNVDKATAQSQQSGFFGWVASKKLPTYKEHLAKVNKELAEAQQNLKNLTAVADPNFLKGPGAEPTKKMAAAVKTEKPKKDANEKKSEFDREMERLQALIDRESELTEVERVERDIAAGKYKDATPAQRDELLFMAQKSDSLKQLEKDQKEINEGLKDAAHLADEEARALEHLTSDTQIGKTEKLREELQLLMDKKDTLGPELFKQAWDSAIEPPKGKVQEFKLELSAGQDLMEQLGTAGIDALERIAIEDDLGDVFKNLLLQLARMIFQLGVAEPLMAELKSAITGGVTPPNPERSLLGGAGNFLSNLASSFFGGGGGVMPPNPFAIPMAGGGSVYAGQDLIVGEYGPERFRPRTSGTIDPARSMGSGGWTLVNNGQPARIASLDPRERRLVLEDARRMVAADIRDHSSAIADSLRARGKGRG